MIHAHVYTGTSCIYMYVHAQEHPFLRGETRIKSSVDANYKAPAATSSHDNSSKSFAYHHILKWLRSR